MNVPIRNRYSPRTNQVNVTSSTRFQTIPFLASVAAICTMMATGCGDGDEARREPAADTTNPVVGISVPASPTHVFEEGQTWSYRTRPGEDSSRVHIYRIDTIPSGAPVFLSYVTGIRLVGGGRTLTRFGLLPLSQAALDRSVVSMVGRADSAKDMASGYERWQEGSDEARGFLVEERLDSALERIQQMLPTAPR